MPEQEAPCVELGSAPQTPSVGPSPSPSEISSTSTPEPHNIRPSPLFRALAMPPPEPVSLPGQEELERRLPGYRRIVIPRELTLIELLKQSSGVETDDEVFHIREAKLRVIAEQVGLRRLHALAPRLRELTLDGSAVSSLRDLGVGLARLKILSINRCGLTSLDGVWSLSALRELHAAGNRLQDLQPLAGLQKLHTINLANNPIEESGRLWTLGVCDSLRHLTLRGTPLSDTEDYRESVEALLPMLQYLDDSPLHAEIENSLEAELNAPHFNSDSESETEEGDTTATSITPDVPSQPQPGPSQPCSETPELEVEDIGGHLVNFVRRRPATTECVGTRPRHQLPPRPNTAQSVPRDRPPSRLHVLNTLMDEEWRCSGSRLTSQRPVCGNIARALRRPSTARQTNLAKEERQLVQTSVQEASRSIADEIPRAPCVEDWAEFKQLTGIDFNMDFNFDALAEGDATSAMDRLERIERETVERLKDEAKVKSTQDILSPTSSACYETCEDVWDVLDGRPRLDPRLEVDVLVKNLIPTSIDSNH